jgi:hypothetical protein
MTAKSRANAFFSPVSEGNRFEGTGFSPSKPIQYRSGFSQSDR